MKIKKILTSLAMCAVFTTECFAGVMGEILWSDKTDFGAGASLYTQAFENGSKNQQEFYVEYEPNLEAVPVVLNGEQIYGKRTIKQAAKYYDDLNYRPLIGINADYFSFKTGIPMGHTISGGELITKDSTGQNAVGFKADGTGFISWLEIKTKLTKQDGSSMDLDCINKWCFSGADASYFLTDYFGDSTKTEGACKFIIFSKSSGNIKIGDRAEFVVEEKFDTSINIAIPDGKFVLVMDSIAGKAEQLAFMDSLQIGDKITMSNEALYDNELWSTVENGMGSVGGRLIEDGTVYTEFEAGSAPRTAVGIKDDGKIIFYVVDGRQSGYSTGLSLKELARRMSELGCVDAMNLDGGGSTAIAGVYPGSDTFEVINNPSDGALRSCANYIFLQDMREPTGVAKTIVLNTKENQNYLTGYKVNVEVESVWDSANYKMDYSAPIFSLSNGEGASSVLDGNTVTLSGTGVSTITVTVAEAQKNLNMNVYDFPDEIIVSDESGNEISVVTLKTGERYSKVLNSKAYKNGVELISVPENFSYEIRGDIGSVSANTFTANTQKEAEGEIVVRAGQLEKNIKVSIINDNPFSDMKSHWAEDAVNSLYKHGIVSGVQGETGLLYNPDNVMTRIEFSSLISKFLELDLGEFEDTELNYKDADTLAPWMVSFAKAMTALGIINGIDGEFKPNEPLNRAQAATIIGRITPEEEDLPIIEASDFAQIPDWSYLHFSKLIKYNVINGYEDNTLRPYRNVTRAEAAKIIHNLMLFYEE